MINTSLVTFVLAALVVLLIPGPGVIYVVTRSLVQGTRAGLISVLGLSTGALAHVIAATLGLSAILLASATAFGIVKLVGALYLIYLGFRALITRNSESEMYAPKQESYRRLFLDGILISVFNPKIAIFFLAFLPQFISPEQGAIQLQFLFLGLVYVTLAICTDGAYALFATSLRRFVSQRLKLGTIPEIFSGLVYLGLGIGLLFANRETN